VDPPQRMYTLSRPRGDMPRPLTGVRWQMVWAAPPLPRRARSTETPPSPHTREFNEPGPERSRGEPGVSAGFLVMVVVREEAPRRKGGVRRGAGLAAPHNGEGLSRGLQHEPDVSARASREPRHSHQFIEGTGSGCFTTGQEEHIRRATGSRCDVCGGSCRGWSRAGLEHDRPRGHHIVLVGPVRKVGGGGNGASRDRG
jgi:hypothetical protein